MGFPSSSANRRTRKPKIFSLWFLISGALVLTSGDALADQIAYITGNTTIWAWDVTANTVTSVDNTGTGLDSLIFDPQGNIVYDVQ